jgi:predicted transcriptional regulator
MNKQQTIELLQKQLPGFYSVEQVISIINDIDAGSSELSEEKLNELTENIYDVVEKKMRNADTRDIVDYDSAEFNISYNNQLELDNVEISSDTISEMVAFEIKEYLTEFFTPNELADAIAE